VRIKHVNKDRACSCPKSWKKPGANKVSSSLNLPLPAEPSLGFHRSCPLFVQSQPRGCAHENPGVFREKGKNYLGRTAASLLS